MRSRRLTWYYDKNIVTVPRSTTSNLAYHYVITSKNVSVGKLLWYKGTLADALFRVVTSIKPPCHYFVMRYFSRSSSHLLSFHSYATFSSFLPLSSFIFHNLFPSLILITSSSRFNHSVPH